MGVFGFSPVLSTGAISADRSCEDQSGLLIAEGSKKKTRLRRGAGVSGVRRGKTVCFFKCWELL